MIARNEAVGQRSVADSPVISSPQGPMWNDLDGYHRFKWRHGVRECHAQLLDRSARQLRSGAIAIVVKAPQTCSIPFATRWVEHCGSSTAKRLASVRLPTGP